MLTLEAPSGVKRGQTGSYWIGGSRPGNAAFVPPPHTAVSECMAALERFLHAEGDGLPVLLRAGLAHVQFETIHPFLDGNGRVGRLLITFLLCHARVEGSGRRAGSALRVHEALKARPIQSMPAVRDTTGLSFPGVSWAMDLLVELGIARELTGKRRNRLFVYDRYLAILNEGTEAP